MKIKVSRPSKEEMAKQGVEQWPIWEKEVSRFDWHYDSIEACYLFEGEVMVQTADGEQAHFGAGDFVTFPKEMDCKWDIRKSQFQNVPFWPISALGSNFNPRNTTVFLRLKFSPALTLTKLKRFEIGS